MMLFAHISATHLKKGHLFGRNSCQALVAPFFSHHRDILHGTLKNEAKTNLYWQSSWFQGAFGCAFLRTFVSLSHNNSSECLCKLAKITDFWNTIDNRIVTIIISEVGNLRHLQKTSVVLPGLLNSILLPWSLLWLIFYRLLYNKARIKEYNRK